jgi:hypothetical protein
VRAEPLAGSTGKILALHLLGEIQPAPNHRSR